MKYSVRNQFELVETLRRIVFVSLALAGLPLAGAATFSVTNCGDAGAGSLRQAVSDANNNPGADTVNFSLTCSTITLQSAITIGADLAIQGPGALALTFSAPTSRVFEVQPDAQPPVFLQVAIRGVRLANATSEGGGAIGAERSNLSIQDAVFASNDAEVGGAISFQSTAADPRTLLIENSTFVGNGASSVASGGAIAARDALVTIRRSLFRQNGATTNAGAGGAIALCRGALLVLDSAFYANRDGYSGAIAILPQAGPTTARIVNTSFVGNVAIGLETEGFGGGAVFGSRADLNIENSTFFANTVQGGGNGAAIDFRGGALTLTNDTIVGNRVESAQAENGSVAAFPVSVTGNNAEIPVNVTVRNTVATATVALDAPKGADVWVGRSPAGTGAALDAQFNFISSLRSPTGSAITPGNALLSTAEDHGGTAPGASGVTEGTFTLIPLLGSPLINAGSTAAARESNDQRDVGFPRVVGSAVDIGAAEFAAADAPQPPVPPVNVPPLSSGTIAAALSDHRRAQRYCESTCRESATAIPQGSGLPGC